jgi:hypothetical protein
MDAYSTSLDKSICDQISMGLYETLIGTFPTVKVLDVDAFVKAMGYSPSIGSIFIVCEGGSFYATSNVTGTSNVDVVEIYNGTLVSHNDVYYGVIGNKYKKLMH